MNPMTKEEVIYELELKYAAEHEEYKKQYDSYHSGAMAAIDEAIQIVEKLDDTGQNWIPVSERLPEEDGQYWITENWGGRRTCLVHFVAKHHISFEEFLEELEIDAVAWKPAILPEPYKVGEYE